MQHKLQEAAEEIAALKQQLATASSAAAVTAQTMVATAMLQRAFPSPSKRAATKTKRIFIKIQGAMDKEDMKAERVRVAKLQEERKVTKQQESKAARAQVTANKRAQRAAAAPARSPSLLLVGAGPAALARMPATGRNLSCPRAPQALLPPPPPPPAADAVPSFKCERSKCSRNFYGPCTSCGKVFCEPHLDHSQHAV